MPFKRERGSGGIYSVGCDSVIIVAVVVVVAFVALSCKHPLLLCYYLSAIFLRFGLLYYPCKRSLRLFILPKVMGLEGDLKGHFARVSYQQLLQGHSHLDNLPSLAFCQVRKKGRNNYLPRPEAGSM